MLKRRRFKQTQSLQDRLATFAKEVREKAALLPTCAEKDDLLQRARQADVASHLDEWIDSPRLQQPK